MRDPARIPRILAKLAQHWQHDRDARLGQLLINLLPPDSYPEGEFASRLFSLEDTAIEALLDQRLQRASGVDPTSPTAPPQPKVCEFCWHGYHGTVLCQESYDPGWTLNRAKVPCPCIGRPAGARRAG